MSFDVLCHEKILDNPNCEAHTPFTLHNRAGRARSPSDSYFQDLNGVQNFLLLVTGDLTSGMSAGAELAVRMP